MKMDWECKYMEEKTENQLFLLLRAHFAGQVFKVPLVVYRKG